MKILIRGAGFQNKGAEAMLRVVQRELGKRIPESIFYASVSSFEIPFAYQSGIIPLDCTPGIRMRTLRSIPFAAKSFDLFLSIRNPNYANAIRSSVRSAYEIKKIESVDAVVDVSGFSYSDTLGPEESRNAYAWVEYCRLNKKPYFFMPQAWGPFKDKETAFWVSKMCDSARLVLSRDDESSRHLAKLLKISVNDVRTAPDIGFCFEGLKSSVGRKILNDLGIESGERPLIAIVPNTRVYNRTEGKGATNVYISHLIRIANFCINSLGATIILAPNEIVVPGREARDDRFLCGLVEARIEKNQYCLMLRDYYRSESIKSILGEVDLLVASRFHSLVFALSQGVPVVALGWSHKYRELLRYFGIEEFVVDHDRLDEQTIDSLVEKAWNEAEKNRIGIERYLARVRDEVEMLFDEVASIIYNTK